MKKRIFTLLALIGLGIAIFGLPPFSGGPDGDYLKAENAKDFKTEVHRHPNGIYEVSALTPMPNVTPEMVRWWFADYMQTNEHYKRWHPTAHLWMDWENKTPGEYVTAYSIRPTRTDIGRCGLPRRRCSRMRTAGPSRKTAMGWTDVPYHSQHR